MKRWRIGIDFHTWDGIYQGSRSHILGIYQSAIAQAPDLDFVFFLNDTAGLLAAYPAFNQPNVQLVKTPSRPSWWRLLWQLPALAWRHRIDLLHMQYRLPLWTHAKTACTIHDLLCESHPAYFPKSFVWQSRLTFRVSARLCDTLLTVSQFTQSELVKRFGIEPRKIAVTHNGVDRARFYPASPQGATSADDGRTTVEQLGLTPGQYILTVGRLEPRKNQANLIRAWGQLGPQAPVLVVAGQPDFSFEDVYQAQKEAGEAGRKVIFLDHVQDHALPALMRHACLFAYPAHAEGFGIPVIEALASGLPVVTSNTTSLPEVAGPRAWLVNPDDVDAIRDGLAAGLALSGAEKETVIAAGLAQAAAFNWDSSASVLIDRFRLALQRR